MLILLTRAIEESLRTAARLSCQGHEVVLSPVIEMVPTGALWPTGVVDCVIATSTRAFELLSSARDWPSPEVCRLIPLLLVGERTAEAACERGFAGSALIAPNSNALAAKIEFRFSARQRFVYLAGRDRSPDLENKLAELGHSIELVEVYAAQPAESLTAEALAFSGTGKMAAVLHYSRRSAEIYLKLARNAGFDLPRVNHVCISQNAAAPLLAAGIHEVLVAKVPNEQAMIAIVKALAGLPEAPFGQTGKLDS